MHFEESSIPVNIIGGRIHMSEPHTCVYCRYCRWQWRRHPRWQEIQYLDTYCLLHLNFVNWPFECIYWRAKRT